MRSVPSEGIEELIHSPYQSEEQTKTKLKTSKRNLAARGQKVELVGD